MEGNEDPGPILTNQSSALNLSEVLKILNTTPHKKCITEKQLYPRGGAVYVLKSTSEQGGDEPRTEDGQRWKYVTSHHLPKGKKSTVFKQMYVLLDKKGAVVKSCKRDIYRKEREDQSSLIVIHYMGDYSSLDTDVENNVEDKQVSMETDAQETMPADSSTSDQALTVSLEDSTMPCSPTATGATVEGSNSEPSTSAVPDSSSEQADLESALETVKAALMARQGSKKPAMVDMFNKLMDSVKDQADDVELCLVVNDKKSGTSSVIGSTDIAAPVRAGSRKRSLTQRYKDNDDDENDDDDDYQPQSKSAKVLEPKKPLDEYEVMSWNGEIIRFPPPKKENFFSFNVVSEEEKKINADFFAHRKTSMKSEDRYLKIRNHIINLWNENKPNYVNKAAVRKGLRDCGDVLCMSRIHTYLTCKGVINFNAVRVSTPRNYVLPKRRKIVEVSDDDLEDELAHDDDDGEQITDNDMSFKSKTDGGKHKGKAAKVLIQSPQTLSNSGIKESRATTSKSKKPSTSVDSTPTRTSGRRTRNVATPNWADIMSGRKSFKKDGAVLTNIKTEASEEEKQLEEEEEIIKVYVNNEIADKSQVYEIREKKSDKRKKGKKNKSKTVDNSTDSVEALEDAGEIEGGEIENTELSEKAVGASNSNSEVSEPVVEKLDGTVSGIENVSDSSGVASKKKRAKKGDEKPESRVKRTLLERKHPCSECNGMFVSEVLLDQHMKVIHCIKGSGSGKDDSNNEEGEVEDGEGNNTSNDTRKSQPDNDDHDGDDDDDYADEMDSQRNEKGEKNTSDDLIVDENEGVRIESEPVRIKKVYKVKRIQGKGRLKLTEEYVDGRRPACEICGTTFLKRTTLARHLLLHSNKVYECPFCAKMMKREDYVFAHIRKVHKEVDLEENPVDMSKYTHYVDNAELDEVREEKAVKKEVTESDVEHMEETENEAEGETDGKENKRLKAVTGLGKKVCPECSKLFDLEEDLEEHMIVEHDKHLKDALYTCPACEKQFKTLVSFQVHKLSHRKKDFMCQHCEIKFPTNTMLQMHKRRDHQIQYGTLLYFGFLINNDKIACEICSVDFDSMSEYIDHRPEHLTFEYMCRNCGNGFEVEEDFKRHQESNCAEQNLHLSCGMCSSSFLLNDTRRKHVASYHPRQSEHYCHHCGKTLTNAEELKTHLKEHEKEKIFICEACEKTFFEKRNLIDHRQLHRSSKNFQCNICLRFYISSKSLQRHLKMHLAQTGKGCKYCKEEFSTKDQLRKHLKEVHEVDLDSLADRDAHTCEQCSKSFTSSSKLHKHMQLHVKEDKKKTSYLCVYCENVFDSNEIPLWKHVKEAHSDQKDGKQPDNKFKCDVCDFSTMHRQRLERHKETHNPTKEFVCKYCFKRFQTTSTLMTHMITHRGKVKAGAKPEPKCTWPNCEKQYMKHSIYKRHLLSHIFKVKNGKDPCDCPKCSQNLTGKTLLMSSAGGDLYGVGYVDEQGKAHVASNPSKTLVTDAQAQLIQVKLPPRSQAGKQQFESMEVLHEAIAKIEDIEKGNENPQVRIHEEGQMDVLDNDQDSTNEKGGAEVDGGNSTENVSTQLDSTEDDEKTATNETVNETDSIQDPENVLQTENENGPLLNQQEASAGADDGNLAAEDDNPEENDSSEAGSRKSPVEVNQVTHIPLTKGAGKHLVDVLEDGSKKVIVTGTMTLSDTGESIGQTETGEFVSMTGYECAVCELMFLHKCKVLEHLESEHPSFAFPKCNVCGRYMVDKKNLADHMFIHDEERRFECDVCSRRFRTKACLRQHLFIHASEKPFNCEHCGHGFTQRGFYEEHLRRHLGVRPFKCNICSKTFVSKNLLKIHMYSHTGSRPHQCPHCPKTFVEKYHLQNHIRNHVDDRPFKCMHCSKSFCVRPKLMRHVTAVHGIEKESISNFYATKIGKGIGYRDKTRAPPIERPMLKKTQLVYIDDQGNIVRQEVQSESELEQFKKMQKAGMGGTEENEPEPVQLEVVTQRDADGNIQTIVPSQFLPENLMALPENEENVIYQEVEGGVDEAGENIELDCQNYTLVTTDSEEGHIQLITQALAGAQQGPGDTDDGHVQVITQEQLAQVQGSDNIQVITADGMEDTGAEGEVQKFSINIGEDGSVNASDIEALRNLYSDQQIVIVLENQQQ